MSAVCQPERCAFIPVHVDEPTAATDELIADIRSGTNFLDSDELDSYARLMAESRRRSISGMACTACGKIVER